ncbi:hypothetical protein CK224_24005 [Mesorhizobium sp. WSM3862]|nr:hypothetical protein CK224_24005 [Mesorhizobium sp. WSM3862]
MARPFVRIFPNPQAVCGWFPNPQSCMRLVRALVVEIHETWLEATRYLNMEHLSRAQEGEPDGIGR